MNSLFSKKWMAWLVLLLLVLNISALGTILYFTYTKERNPRQQPEQLSLPNGLALMKELNLGPAQTESFLESRNLLFRQARPVKEMLREERKEIVTEISKQHPDTMKLNALADSMGVLQAQLKKTTFRHFLRVKAFCDPAQVEKLTDFYERLFLNEDADRGPGMGRQHRFGRNRQMENQGMRQDSLWDQGGRRREQETRQGEGPE